MSDKTFVDSYYREESGLQLFCYRTNRLAYEEILSGGVYYASIWNIAGFVPQTVTVPGTYRGILDRNGYPRAFELAVNGRDLPGGYSLVSFEKHDEKSGLHTIVTLHNAFEPITVKVHTILDGNDIIERWLTLVNESDNPMPVGRISVMGGGLFGGAPGFVPENQFRFGYMMDSYGTCEGDYHTFNLPRGEFSFGRTLYSERHRSPFFTLENKGSGVTVLGQLGFSGGYTFRFRNYSVWAQTMLSYRVDLGGDLSPVLILKPRETFETPAMHLCMVAGDLDAAVNKMNDHVRILSAPYRKDMIIEEAIGPEIDMSLDMVLRAIDRAAYLGAEIFYIDASWYGPDRAEYHWAEHCGDWNPKEFRYSMSMTQIRDYAHAKGLKFGLWAALESIGPKSGIYDSEIPPKLLDFYGNYLPDDICHSLDVSVKEGADWAFDTICSIIDRYGLDFYRVDSGAHPYDASSDPNGMPEERDLRYYNNWYQIFRRLREKYPDVIFQNCAGGGARLDFGMMVPMSNTQLTDQQTAPMTFRVLNGVSMQLPCEYFIEAFVACNGHLQGSFNFMLNIARFGNPHIGWTILPGDIAPNDEQNEKIKRVLNTYREIIRPNLPDSRIYHHTPEVDEFAPNTVGILELGAKDRRMSMVGVFTLYSSLLAPISSSVSVG